MRVAEALKFFGEGRGARSRLARALDVTVGAISQWGELVPEGQAYKLEVLTDGALSVDPAVYKKAKKRRAA